MRRDYTDSAQVMLGGRQVSGSRVRWNVVFLSQLVQYAYDLGKNEDIAGMPGWTKNGQAQYDIEAKAPGDRPPTDDQLRVMFQNLLADRFQLKFHREMRETAVYNLVVAKGGPKLDLSAIDAPFKYSQRPKEVDGGRATELIASKMTTDGIANNLSRSAGRRVFNQTHLGGLYNVDLVWDANNSGAGPSIFTAVQEQLGLKLEPAKVMLDFMVVDHVEPPSEN